MRAWFIAGVLLALLVSPASAGLKFGESAPSFSLSDRKANIFTLSKVVGQAGENKVRGVIVTFFASWCGICRRDLPLINALVNEYASKGVKIVIIDVKETNEVISALLRELNVDKPVVLGDHDGAVADQYGIRFLPTTYFIDAEGKIRDVIFGGMRDASEFKKSAETLLK